MIVVIPTNRSVQLEALGPLIDSGARFIIVDDSEGSVRVEHPQFQVYNWSDRRQMLGPLDIGIPRRNGACRDLGFLIAWRESDDDELIVALDDDCVVEDPDFEQNVSRALLEGPAWSATGTGPFFNIIDLYDGLDGTWIFPRGFPYSLRGAYASYGFDPVERQPADFHLGLWQEVFDINGIDKLYLDQWSFPDARLTVDGALIPSGVWLCLCSMNMQFRRQLIPAVYQLPMHVESSPGMHIDRYGDIWGGFILKMLMDIKGDRLSVGAPMIRHLKDGNVERNTLQEHLAHLVNDEFIDLLRVAGSKIEPASYHEMMTHLTEELQARSEKCSPILKRYLDHLCTALHAWLALLNDR